MLRVVNIAVSPCRRRSGNPFALSPARTNLIPDASGRRQRKPSLDIGMATTPNAGAMVEIFPDAFCCVRAQEIERRMIVRCEAARQRSAHRWPLACRSFVGWSERPWNAWGRGKSGNQWHCAIHAGNRITPPAPDAWGTRRPGGDDVCTRSRADIGLQAGGFMTAHSMTAHSMAVHSRIDTFHHRHVHDRPTPPAHPRNP